MNTHISSEAVRTDRFRLHIANLLFLLTALIFLLSFANVNRAFGNEIELRLNHGTALPVSIVLSQSAAVESMDINITGYDKTVIEASDISLAGGIFENTNYLFNTDDSVAGQLSFLFYTFSNILTLSGDMIFINFNIKAEGNTTLSLARFECNESPVSGGFKINGSVYQSVKIRINNPPAAPDGTFQTDEDTVLNNTLPATDPNDDPLTYTLIDKTTNGTIEITDQITGVFTYTPDKNISGTDTFTYKVGDGLLESDIGKITVEIRPVNDAPVLDPEPVPILSGIVGDETANKGNSVADIVADGSVTDIDIAEGSLPPEALAVVSVDNTHGKWEFSIDSGTTWTAFAAGTSIIDLSAQARLLDTDHRIRFVPADPYWEGRAEFTFRAWDKSSGTAGQTADTGTGGGTSAFSAATNTASIAVTSANKAPVLDNTKSPVLSSVPINPTENKGNTVAEIVVTDSVTDPDISPAPKSVAVIAVDNSNGKWEYSTDAGITWTPFTSAAGPADLSVNARLLDSTHKIRFVPKAEWFGIAAFTFRAWDKTSGKAGETANASQGGGILAFSSATDTANIEVIPKNFAPVLDAKQSPKLTAIASNNSDSKGNSVAEIVVDGSFTDRDGSIGKTIAVIGVDNTNGKWQYSIDNGVSWMGLSSETGKADLSLKSVLMKETYKIRFVPKEGYIGTAAFTFRAWDMTTGTVGGRGNTSEPGGSSAFSSDSDEAVIEILKANYAPVLDHTYSPVLSPLTGDETDNTGNTVAEIVADGSISDKDTALAPEAVAVIAVDNTNGTWQYSTDSGKIWTVFSATIGKRAEFPAQARLLDATHRIRFVPNKGWIGTSSFTFRAWDKSSGIAGGTSDAATGGETSAFSLIMDDASITVGQINHAPVLDAEMSPKLTAISADDLENQGNTVANIIPDGSISDEDEEVLFEAIAVISTDNTYGVWQYSADGGKTWSNFTSELGKKVDFSDKARLLTDDCRIRFIPDKGWTGTAAFTFRAWDKTAGIAGGMANAVAGGGISAFSQAWDETWIEVKAPNHAPVLNIGMFPALSPINKNSFDSSGNSIAEIVADGSISDADNKTPPEAVAVIATDNTNGVWQYSTDNGETWTAFSDIIGSRADISARVRLLDETHRIRFVPNKDWSGEAAFTFRAWDKARGTAGETADAGKGGGTSSFSSESDDASIKVKAKVNKAPVLDVSQSPQLSKIKPNDFENKGNSVAEIIVDGSITDDSVPPAEAIAVIAADHSNGLWQYSTDNGTTWTDFPAVESDAAILLAELNRIRFVPNQDWQGTATFTFRAWDKSSGTAGKTADTTVNGGTSAFSVKTDEAGITVKANFAPILDAAQSPTLTPIKVNAFDSNGNSVAEIVVDGSVSDRDGNVSEAVAVIAVDNSNGKWQYSTGGKWSDFSAETGIVDLSAKARLLSEIYRIRFVPNKDWTGTATFTFRAWDKTVGTAGQTAVPGTGGDPSAFSSATDEALISVSNKPVAHAGPDQSVSEGATVTLDGSASSGVIAVYKWEQSSGTGVTLSDVNAIRPYFTAPQVSGGQITLTFTLTVKTGKEESSDTVTVTVSDVPGPIAGFEVSPASGNVPLDVSFRDTSQGNITGWQWDFGNGSQSMAQHPTCTYSSPGIYTVSLTVKGPGGANTAVKNNYIVVNAAALKADFEALPTQGALPLNVSFKRKVQGEITEWLWDFGDGVTSTVGNPVHVYEAAGKYSVSLTVKGPGGTLTEVKKDFIQAFGKNISGKVIAADTGIGLKNCRIEVWQGDVFKAEAVTDVGGAYSVKKLPGAGNLIVTAKPPAGTSEYFYQFYNGKISRNTADILSTLNGNLTDIDFVLERIRAVGISGRVHDGQNGLAGVEVNIFSESAVFGVNVVTDRDGNYTVAGLRPADDYRISVRMDEFNAEFYYAIPEGEIPGEYIPDYSVFSSKDSTAVTPSEPPLKYIDVIADINQGGNIKGRVFAADRKTPLQGVWVNAWSDALNSGNSGQTDENGRYTIWGLEAVSEEEAETKGYIVETRSSEYAYQIYSEVTKKEDAERVGTGATGINFYLDTGYAISGKVTDPKGKAVSGAEVIARSFSDSQKQGNALSGKNGVYRIHDLPLADDYIVQVFSSDYPVQYYRLTAEKELAEQVDIIAGNAENIDFVLDKGPVIKGVVYIGGTPAPADLWVSVWSDTSRTGNDVQTDEQGRYEVFGLQEDVIDYVISVRNPGYVPGFYHGNGTVYKWEDAERVGPSEEDRNIVLIKGFSIRGTVTYKDKPVSGIRVEALSPDGRSVSAVSDMSDEFNYVIEGLLSGTYSVTVQPENYMNETKQAEIKDKDIVLDFALADEPERSISGSVSGLEAGEEVKLTASSLSKNISKSLNLKGTGEAMDYRFTGLKPAADYVVELISKDYPYQVYNSKYRLKNADLVNIKDADAFHIDFMLSSDMAGISGEVIFPGDASPGETAYVDVFSRTTGAESSAKVTVSDSQIVPYSIGGLLRATDYAVSVRSDKYMDCYYNGTEDGAASEDEARLIDTTDAEEDIVNFRLRPGTAISGRVTDGNREGQAGITVEAWSRLTGYYGSTATLSDGTYSIEGLGPAVDYKVEVRDPSLGSFFYNSEKTVRIRSLATSVNTTLGNAVNIDILIDEVENISGTVTDKDGYPLSLMWVEAYSELQQSGNGVFTNVNGRYNVMGLPKSRDYRVSARPDWFTVPQEKYDISSGSIAVNFMLNPREGYKLEGIVTDKSGRVIPNVTVEVWSSSLKIRGDIWSVTDSSGKYLINGLPKADDYVLTARPPKDSVYAFFSRQNISIPSENDTIDIAMDMGMNLTGTVTDKVSGEAVKAARVIAVSEMNYFVGKTVSNGTGQYYIPNVPEDSVCDITVVAEDYIGETKKNQVPGSGIDFFLSTCGSVTGTVKDSITGEFLAGVRVGAYSESMQRVPDYSGMAVTDRNGRYVINALRYTDQQENLLSDYVITVYAQNYPPVSKGARRAGSTVDFTLTRGPENELSGTVMEQGGELTQNIDFMVEIFDSTGKYVTFLFADADGSFKFGGLDPEESYSLKFTALDGDSELLIQWAGQGGTSDYDTGIENAADPDEVPAEAKYYSADTTVHFRFSRSIDGSMKYRKPGEVTELRSPSHVLRDDDGRAPTALASFTHDAVVSNNPYITVTWEPSESGYDESYYYEFNQISDYEITKRNAPRMLPVETRKVTGPDLSGDDVSFYFHVAAVDDRGKIGPTASREFRIDTVPPSNGMVIVPERTASSAIVLILGATGVKEVYLSNSGYGQGGDWETRVKEQNWRLSEGDGPKKIYIQFRDEAGNIANYLAETEKVPETEESELTVEDQAFSVNENSPENTAVGTVAASGPGTLTFSITEGNTNETFAIDSTTGKLTVKNAGGLDYETKPVYTLTVTVSDGINSVTATVSITLNDINEETPNSAPTAEDQTFSINENSVSGTVLGTITATDAEGDVLTYSITSGNTNNAFALNSSTGELTVRNGSELDYERTPAYTLTVQVSDGIAADTATITITIADVNEDRLTVSDQSFSVNENSAKGTAVGNLVASGPIAGLAYRIIEGNTDEAFAINGGTGNITVNDGSRLDYESTPVYTLMIEVSDGTTTVTATVTITINDVNEDKLMVKDQAFSIDEGSADGASVGTVVASGPSDSLTFAVTEGNTDTAFAIDGTGHITVNDSSRLNAETIPVYILTVEVSDGVTAVAAKMTVNINKPDAIINNQTFSVDENSPGGTSVGTVTAKSSEPGATLTYAILSGNTAEAFTLNSRTGEMTVNNGAQLDYESLSVYVLTVEVSDGKNTGSATVTININNIEEPGPVENHPPVINDQHFSIDENSLDGTPVGTVAASDADPADTLTFTITAGNTNNAFAINEESGEITVRNGSELDYETTPDYTLTVQVYDGTDTTTAHITISLNDVNEDRLAVKDQSFSIDENSSNGTSVATIVASGPSATLSFILVSGNTDDAFEINGRTGHITVKDGSRLDYETVQVYVLTVDISDGTDTVTAKITVNINDLNEDKLTVRDQAFSLDQDAAQGTIVGTVIASGPLDTLVFSITAGNIKDAFAINSTTGQLTVNNDAELNYESEPVYLLSIEVSDGKDTVTASVTINVNKPGALINNQKFSIPEDSADGASVGTVAAVTTASLTFKITAGNTDNIFEINSKTGEITIRDSSRLDYETTSSYSLTIEVSDGTKSDSATITIAIENVDETKLSVKNRTFSVDEDSSEGTSVGTVTASGSMGPLTYRITKGNTDTVFAIDSNTGGITVKNRSYLNYDISPEYVLTVEVSDGKDTVTAVITIRVNQKSEYVPVAWEWSNPIPTGNTLNAVRGISGKIFAVGDAGTILRYDGATWTTITIEISENLRDIWGSSVPEIFAVGDAGVILRFDGTVWNLMSGGTSESLYGVWGSSGTDVFAVGNAGTILHYDGTLWQPMNSGTENALYSIWGYIGSDIFAVGENGIILHYDGTAWQPMNSGTSGKLTAVQGSSGSDVFVSGDMGRILHYDGTAWQTMNSNTSENLKALRINEDGSKAFAAGNAGTILYYDGAQWHEADSGTSDWLYGIGGASDTDIFAVGQDGIILRYDGFAWFKMNSGTSAWLKSIWASSDADMFAVGGSFDYDTSQRVRVILRSDGTEWHEMLREPGDYLYDIWGSSPSNIFAVGGSGTILHYNGSVWQEMNSGTTEWLYSVRGFSDTDIVAVGDNGTILRYDGSDWYKMDSGTSERLYGIWGTSGTDIFAVGDNGTVLQYDGIEWFETDSGTSECFYSVWGTSGTDIFAVGDAGIVLHYNGIEWSQMKSITSESLYSVWGTSGANVFAAGDHGTVLHYNGTDWHKSGSGTYRHLRKVWGFSESEIFTVGDTGTILNIRHE